MPAHGLQARAGADPVTPVSPAVFAEPEYAVPSTFDRAGRVLAPVMVNGQGPFRFILDTGANRSALSPKLAALLELTPSVDDLIAVHGVTGSADLPFVRIERMQAGGLTLVQNKRMPVLNEAVLANADGLLGIEGLARATIDIEFTADRVTISRSESRKAMPGVVVIPVSLRHGGLLLASARVGRVRAKAIIDTGAERSLGNLALRDALAAARGAQRELGTTTVYGATPALGTGESILAPTIVVGEAEIHNLLVTFADLHVFRIWNLEDQPTLLIGMDLLGTVERIVIDYYRREIQIKP